MQFGLLFLVMVLASFAEVISIGAVLPFLGALTAPDRIFIHPMAQPIIQALSLTEPKQLLLPVTIAFAIGALFSGAMRLILLWALTRLSHAIGADFQYQYLSSYALPVLCRAHNWWAPLKLEESLKYLEAGEDVVYRDLFLVTKHSQTLNWRKARACDLNSPVFNDLIKNRNSLNNLSVVLRKGFLQEIRGVSENVALITMEDYDAWLRVEKITEKFKRIPKTLGYYWAGGGNASNASRTITALEAFEQGYADDIENLSTGNGFLWVNYFKGRAYYKLGSYDIAKGTLKKIYQENAPLLMTIKV